MSAAPSLHQNATRKPTALRRAMRLGALLVGTALLGCTTETSTVVLNIRIKDELARPQFVSLTWTSPSGRGLKDVHIPAAKAGDLLASVSIDVTEETDQPRDVLAIGLKGVFPEEQVVSAAKARFEPTFDKKRTLGIDLSRSDMDGDGALDLFDTCPTIPGPCSPDAGKLPPADAGAPDASAPDAADPPGDTAVPDAAPRDAGG